MDETLVNGWLTNEAAQQLMTSAGKDLATLTAAAKQKGFKAVPLGVKASISFDNKIERQASRNVIGILPGSERPDEYVIYRSEEHTSELRSLMRISYAVFCLKTKKKITTTQH